MNFNDAVAEVKKAAERSGYLGMLTKGALEECADVYIKCCDKDGNPRPRVYMRSGAGCRQTNLTEMQWLLVRTPSFKRWFGKSVVTDENGDPKVMYHGSWKDFSEFKPSSLKLSKTAMTLWSGPGFYFTDKERIAKIYSAGHGGNCGNVYDVFVRLENPLVVDETGNAPDGRGISNKQAVAILMDGDNTQWLDSGLATDLVRMDEEECGRPKGRHHYKGLTRERRVAEFVSRLKTDVVRLKVAARAYGAKSQDKLLKAIVRHTGYDGVVHTITPGVKEWVVYDPNAIKSANRNDGEYAKRLAAIEDSEPTESINRHNLQKEGSSRMIFKPLIDSLTKLVGNPARSYKCGMDIVDRNGRHHEPKGVPPGGQFENEGQYATTAKAKEEYYHKTFAHGTDAKTKKLREEMRQHCASVLSRIDSSKLGNDTAKHYFKEQVHKYADMPKQAVLTGANSAFEDMKRHASTYEGIKDMGKDDFAKWVEEHPEYNSGQMQNLLTNKAFNKKFKIKNAAGEYEDQDHEAWEEAKMLVARKAVASMLDYMSYIEALNNTPDGMIDSYIHGKGTHESHKSGHEDYAKVHGIKHGEGEYSGKVTMSEIQAAESELSKANAEAKDDEGKVAYMHAISHFLGKDGGLRDPDATKEGVMGKVKARIDAKQKNLDDAKTGGDEEAIKLAQHDLDSTYKAAGAVKKILGIDDVASNETPTEVGAGVPSQSVTSSSPQVTHTLNDSGKKFMGAIKEFIESDLGKKIEKMTENVLKPDEIDAHKKTLDGNGIAKNKALLEGLHKAAKEAKANGDKSAAKSAWAKYLMTAKHLHDQLAEYDK